MAEKILSFLNENIGPEWATYLGLIFGLISLFIGSKIIKRRSISQKATANSGTVIQVAGNYHIQEKKSNDSESTSK